MRPNPAFLKKLRAYDPDLRVVWSATKEVWLIERQVRRGKPGLYFDSPDPDVVRRAKEGYVHVGNVHPKMLDERVLLNLWRNDMWAHGGAKAVNAALDDYYESKARHEAETQRQDLKQIAAEMWDSIAWKRGGRVRVPAQVVSHA